MSTQTSDSLSRMHDLAAQILSLLPKVVACHTSPPIVHLDHLRLVTPQSEVLLQDLMIFEISAECKHTLISLYDNKIEALRHLYLNAYKEAVLSWHSHGQPDEHFYSSFRNTLEHRFSSHTRSMWNDVLAQVRRRTVACQNSTVGPPDFGHVSLASAADASSKTSRSHDLDAIRILEQAFEITPNITQAEKFRLAEVTGLQPKQVTIWFQNRRNRKGRKGLALKHVAQSPLDLSPSKRETTPPPSSPTRDFTLSEKKRKSYGALGRSSSDYSDSDSDSPSSHLKKPRLPSACSDDSEASASSIDQITFTPWSTPSSRSTSSSSASSSQSDIFDSPRRPHNLFKYINPKYEGRADVSMPHLTIGTPQKMAHQGLAPAQRSPFTSDVHGGSNSQMSRLDLSGLQLNMGEAFDRDFRESVQRVFSGSGFDVGSYRSVSSSSWGSQAVTTDDDGWVDEDDFDASLGGRHDTPIDAAVQGQHSMMPPAFHSVNTPMLGQTPPQALHHQSVAPTMADAQANSSPDGSSFCPPSSNNEPVDLARLLELAAAAPAHLPTSSPFASQPQQPLPTEDTNLDLEMTDIQSLFDRNLFDSSSLPGSQQSNDGSGALQGNAAAEAQFCMNFDMSSNAFSMV
ncbi:homeodomain transcription factor bW2 [Sporisorium reilianum f. sp. reilianum]|uniref:Homeodomain transcription factor bW2 n=1 Tax=Sporisorium reilianum f. sp. reilianum TaxID=72559 RepID=A0A2N8U7E2_9BASI|nr:homeodomain transcription factor bW2 [Sporisorium reilianum f. sp. reilianum]DBA11490.1 TPA_inf: bW [Sporisorium reilianum f. sp. reilianum]